MKLNNRAKFLLVFACMSIAVVGFLVKLPSEFRHFDKQLHTIFYFTAAAFLNLLFANRNIIRHTSIFISLYLFGIAIEYAQEYSNKLFHKKIHGRYDIQDVQANLKGLILFSLCWAIIIMILFIYNKIRSGKAKEYKEGL